MHTPYRDMPANEIYHRLFCDDVKAMMPIGGREPAAWQQALAGGPAHLGALRDLAHDEQGDARVRALAFRQLQAMGQQVPRRVLLGVVVEVPLDTGLDTLAVYADGSARFIHGSGHMSFVEGRDHPVYPAVQRLLAAAQAVVDCIGPADHARRPAPQQNLRMSFIVSDGLYYGEGPMQVLMNDPMGGPVVNGAAEVLGDITSLVAG